MEELFFTVLGMSGTASAVILVVMLARLALRKAPKVFSYALWAVVLLRLLCPFTFSSPWGMVLPIQVESSEDAMAHISVTTSMAGVVISVASPEADPASASSFAPADAPVISAPDGPLPAARSAPRWQSIAGFVWLTGIFLLMGYSAVSLVLLRRRLIGSMPLAGEKNVRLADHIPSPFVLGLVRPQIYLPSGLPEHERDYILLHERTHIRRFDHVTRALAWLALAVHWFNPLAWLAFHLAGRDMEMSCDEAVLRKMGRDIRADYSSSLLRLSAGGRLPAGPLAFEGGDTQKRIKNVLNYKKPAFWAAAAALIGVLCAGVALATSRTVEMPDVSGASIDDLTADLSLYIDENGSAVHISGTIDDFDVSGGTSWSPTPAFDVDLLGQVFIPYPPFGEPDGMVYAWWADADRTAVTVSGQPLAMSSSGAAYTGYRTFTVALDKSSGAVVESLASVDGPDENIYLASLSDEEAVAFARFAAKLLTAAEDFHALCQVPTGALNPAELSDSLDADLTMTMDQAEDSTPFVRISGTIGGAALSRAVWHPQGAYSLLGEHSGGELTMEYTFDSGGATLGAWWTDEARTSVTVSSKITVIYSSYIPCGWWEFTVDLTTGTVTTMKASPVESTLPYPVKLYPQSITGAEAVQIARVSAKALTAGEDFYNNHIGDRQTPTILTPVYSLNENGYCVNVEGLDCDGALWNWDPYHTRIDARMGVPEKGMLGLLFITNPRFLGGRFAGAEGSAAAAYYPDEHDPLLFVGFDDHIPADNEIGWDLAGTGTYFTVELASGNVTKPQTSGDENLDSGLSDAELASLAQALAQIIQGAADFYDSSVPGPPYDELYTLLEGAGRVRIGQVGDAYVEWDDPRTLYFDGDPGFCCPRLAGRTAGYAAWNGQDRTILDVHFTVNDERVSGSISGFDITFAVDLNRGTVLQRDFKSQVEGETLELTDQEMIGIAHSLDALMKGARQFYHDAQRQS